MLERPTLSPCFHFRTELLKAKGQLNVEEIKLDGLDGPEADQGHDGGPRRNENGRKSNSLEIPEEAVSGETNDVSEDEETGLGTGRVRNRARHRSYSIRGETGDVTDGRIVV